MVYSTKRKRSNKKYKRSNKKYKRSNKKYKRKQKAGSIADTFVNVYDFTEGYITKSLSKKTHEKQHKEYDFFQTNFNKLL